MPTNEQLIREAIANKMQVRAFYKGHERWFCPHAIGTKDGRTNAMCYLFGGTGSRGVHPTPSNPANGPPENWRCLELALMSNITLNIGQWYTCQKHTERNSCIDHVYLEASR